MPAQFLSAAERARFNSFPANLSVNEIIDHFTLTSSDHAQIPATASVVNQFGFALQLLLLRFLGFHLADFTSVPDAVTGFVASQLNAPPEQLTNYGTRGQTRNDHARTAERYLGFGHPSEDDYGRLTLWLQERALEHDRPVLLLQLLCERFLIEKLVRPGFSVIERMVTAARVAAETEIYRRLMPGLDEARTQWLDSLLISPQPNHPSPLAWLRQSATANTPRTILTALDKLKRLQQWRVGEFDLSVLNPNRRKQLAQIGFRSTAQALQRMPKAKRYPVMLAFLFQLHEEVLDELVELFDRMLQKISNRTDRRLVELEREIAHLAGDNLKLLQNLMGVVLDESVSDQDLRRVIYKLFGEDKLRSAFSECERMTEPLDDNYFKLLASRYSYLRQFIPTFLTALPIDGNSETAGLREAIGILKELDGQGKRGGRRKIPAAAPRDFIPAKWWNQVFAPDDRINRKFYELAVLFELRRALRSGDVWVEGSRRFARLDSYLIPTDSWTKTRPTVCDLFMLPADGARQLQQRQAELEEVTLQFDILFDDLSANSPVLLRKARRETPVFDEQIDLNGKINVRLENNKLVVTKLVGDEKSDSLKALDELISERLPAVELTDILIEVDAWTGFSKHFEHPNGNEPRSPDALAHCYAGILAQACNFGLVQMGRMSGLSYRKLAWHTTWYLREETLKDAFSTLVNYQNRLPLAALWGDGTLSSSDGQRFPVGVKSRNAVTLPKYFGYGRGLTYYTWTSDQYSQFGTKVIPSTIRDATYVLDEILDNETELSILEHTTDTAGYTDLVFGLFDLLGLQFSPRLADLADQKLYRFDKYICYNNVDDLIKAVINQDLILRHWDEMLRIAGSLKQGFVTASLLISKLQSYPRQNSIMRALQEYGRIGKTIFILKYLQSPDYQKRVVRQLNKGEAIHSLRNFLFVANERQIRKRHQESQLNQAACLNLVTNAVTLWNTVYMSEVIEQLKREGYEVKREDVEHLSPARSEHINVYGRYYFNVEEGLKRKGLRALRNPNKEEWLEQP